MPMRPKLLPLFAVLLWGASLPSVGLAEAGDRTAFRTTYRSAIDSRIDRCGLCHAQPSPRLTSYGYDYRASDGSFLAIENLDSDRDGYSNLTEILALTFPGDPADKPSEVSSCAGDCSGDRAVTVDEILAIVNVALGTTGVDGCFAADLDADGAVTIDELLTAVTVALTGCPE